MTDTPYVTRLAQPLDNKLQKELMDQHQEHSTSCDYASDQNRATDMMRYNTIIAELRR